MVRWGLLLLIMAAAVYAAPTCLVDEQLRQDCGYIGITQGECESRGCCWNPASSGSSFPWCFYLETRDCGHYVATGTSQPAPGVTELFLDYAGTRCNYYGPEIEALKVIITTERDFTLHVKIVDRTAARWEVPESVIPRKDRVVLAPSPLYRFGYVSQPFGFFVQRSDTGEVIFNTTASSSNPQFRNLVFENQYLEISTQLPSGANVYGIGERRFPLRLQEDRQYPIWTADELTPFQENNYGSHPFYVENRNGKAHGVLLLNSNGMDVDLGKGFLRYRVIGGVFDFYFFLGPSPNAVVSQYLELVGKPYFVPYWSLGFHQCRWGYKNIETVAEVVSKYRESNIPLETMWTDIDYMDGYRDWTFDPIDYPIEKVRAFVDELHKNNQHYILITDPGIKNESGYYYFDYGRDLDVFLKDASGNDFVGRVWPGNTVFPDFFHPRAYEYWKKSIDDFLKLLAVDGLWVDMNEVANFCNGFCDDKHRISSKRKSGKPKKEGFDPNNPPYQINNRLEHLPLNFKTTDMDVTHYGGVLEYDAHNLYGTMEVIATKQALEEITKKRAFVLSRSTFSGSGHHGGHWTGDNFAEWEHLYHSIPAMLNLNIFGIPYVGADICGFASSTTEELCARWMQLGAFYPFSRNHNNDNSISQEPYLWDSVAEVSRIALRIRYSILSYYYTLFYIASTEGSTVVRPLFFEFPTDPALADNDRQFLLGDAILFSPVLTQGATSVEAYFPAGRWYDFYTHAFADYKEGTTKVLDAPLEKINIHIREGRVITLQTPAYSTAETKLSDYTLVVALSQTGSASGQLYLDDGESLNVGDDQSTFVTYTASTTAGLGRLVSAGRHNYPASNKIARVEVLGVSGSVSQVRVGGAAVPFEFNAAIGKLTVPNLAVSFLSLTLEWQ